MFRKIKLTRRVISVVFSSLFALSLTRSAIAADEKPVRVFIFAGQSNMLGADSRVDDIDLYPPFVGLGDPQGDALLSYCVGRETKTKSDGWTELKPIKDYVGPELSFAREVGRHSSGRVAIIKVAAGGTHLGGDWNPDEPSGFKMYPLALDWVRQALAELDARGIRYRLEGFMWHQGENDMFDPDYMANYGGNLRNFIAGWRRDLNAPRLRFYVGELCTKTIWGMDLRPRMYAISLGQREVTDEDPFSEYVPTSHVGVEIGSGVGLHYHYGTLGQLEHGVNYAHAYLRHQSERLGEERAFDRWPYPKQSKIKLFVLAGHRNMEGERAFVQRLESVPENRPLASNRPTVAYRYSIGGGVKRSKDWEPLGPAGFYDTFGPELSFAASLESGGVENVAIAKFTHSGSQVIDWTPEGSVAESRNLYEPFITFVKDAIADLQARGHEVELAGMFYHLGENDMSWGPFRKAAPDRMLTLVRSARRDFGLPDLTWYVSQQPPTDDKRVNQIDVTARIEELVADDDNLVHLKVFDLPKQEKKLVIDTPGIVWLGERLAEAYLKGL